jgi:hypothetical protein
MLLAAACALLFSSESFIYSADIGSKDVVELNNILIEKKKKEIRIRVKLALKEGILEYLLVNEQGKAYESVFKITENKPSDLNFALLLIGSQPMDFETFFRLREENQGSIDAFKGHTESLLEIDFRKGGRAVNPDTLLKNREGSKKPLVWVHTASFFLPDGRYAGDLELSHIGIWPDRSAVINLLTAMGNPYRGELGLEMNKENKEIEIDQEYEIIIRRRK